MPDAFSSLPALLHRPSGCLHHEDSHVQQRPGQGEAGCGHHCQVSRQLPSHQGDTDPSPLRPHPALPPKPSGKGVGFSGPQFTYKTKGFPKLGCQPWLSFAIIVAMREGGRVPPHSPHLFEQASGREECQEVHVAHEPLGTQSLPWPVTLTLPHPTAVCVGALGRQDEGGGLVTVPRCAVSGAAVEAVSTRGWVSWGSQGAMAPLGSLLHEARWGAQRLPRSAAGTWTTSACIPRRRSTGRSSCRIGCSR